jgi:CheY-like chemotaxis protein
MLEEDGRIDEEIFKEYASLNLLNPPAFIHADNREKAFKILEKESIDLVITMLSTGDTDAFELSKKIKQKYSYIPIVVLTPFSREVRLKLRNEDLSAIDYVFCWLGSTEILVAIIKLIEDRMNFEHDVTEGVQTILLVEDSIRFYSSYLPIMYKIVLKQSRTFMSEGLNEYKSMMRMRGRPKILLATNYDQAISFYEQYKESLLGIISDVRYKRKGVKDSEAGFRLCERVRKDDQHIPFLLQSSEISNKAKAEQMNVGFLYKNSKTMTLELKNYLFQNLAFGDFIFRHPETLEEIGRAQDLRAMQKLLSKISVESLRYHFNRDDLSKWLNARALFPVAKKVKPLKVDDFMGVEEATKYIIKAIAGYRYNQGSGVIAKFDRNTYDEYIIFARIGDGSLGGKARGLAFIDSFLKRKQLSYKYDNVVISIPRTLVLTTDVFDAFMEKNDLYHIGLSDRTDQEILELFINARLPDGILEDLKVFVNVLKNPIAIRSSSLLEDSHYQPFAGIYSTYMIPYVASDQTITYNLLRMAIKSVFASVFFKSTKSYMEATSNAIDEEKMAIVIQEVCGTRYGNIYYPTISGVARSVNFYPIPPEKTHDGIAQVGLGLGKITVEGGSTLRFSPKYPKNILQLSSPEMAMRDSQSYFYALDLDPESFKPSTDDSVNIKKIKIKDAEKHNSLKYVASTYDFQNNVMRDGVNYDGKKIITFSNILNHNSFPLAEILDTLLQMGQSEMNAPIEIEFAVNLDVPKNTPGIFNFLQIRPIVESQDEQVVNIGKVNPEDTIIYCKSALGNGNIQEIRDFVYIKPSAFNPSKSKQIAANIEKINDLFMKENKNYVLVGPGRWGSSDPWLGIPVNWAQICAARVIVESGLENFRIDPSQGTHFFQNLTSFRVGYFTINPYINDGYYDVKFLSEQGALYEDEFIRHIRFASPLDIMIDGKNNIGVIYKPKSKPTEGELIIIQHGSFKSE